MTNLAYTVLFYSCEEIHLSFQNPYFLQCNIEITKAYNLKGDFRLHKATFHYNLLNLRYMNTHSKILYYCSLG